MIVCSLERSSNDHQPGSVVSDQHCLPHDIQAGVLTICKFERGATCILVRGVDRETSEKKMIELNCHWQKSNIHTVHSKLMTFSSQICNSKAVNNEAKPALKLKIALHVPNFAC